MTKMNETPDNSIPRSCPTCGSPLAGNVLDGHCPNCLLALVRSSSDASLDSDVGTVSDSSQANGPEPGRQLRYFGNYELLDEVARGGMGVVYRARQTKLNRTVAVKMILGGQLADAASVRRFLSEAEAAANLQHPNIVAIHEVGQHEGRYYFSMDFVEGRNLAELLQVQPISATRAAQLLRTLAEAVHYAHQRGTLHRDLKPQNILIDTSGMPRITDFGLAKNMKQDSGLTRTGAVMGSPSYMPPEQASGRLDQVGPASDVYSLGAILYEMLTGQAPFSAETPVGTLRKVLEEEPLPPSKLRPNTPPDLETICLKCLEKRPEHRYTSARALVEELDRFLQHEPIQARPAGVLRKAWSWSVRHPWVITGFSSLLLLALVAVAYGLWEQVRFLRWTGQHQGEKPSREVTEFFSSTVVGFLAIEFFLLQALPLTVFLRQRGGGQVSRRELWIWSAIGLGQLAFGLDLVARGMAAGTWIEGFWFSHFWLILPALTNAWFGASVILLALRGYRAGLVEEGAGAATHALAPVLVRKPAAVFAAMAVQVIAFAAAAHTVARETLVPAYLSALGATLVTMAAAAIRLTRALDATTYLPLLVGGALLSLVVLPESLATVSTAWATGLVTALAMLKLGGLRVEHPAGDPAVAGQIAPRHRRFRPAVIACTLTALLVLLDLVGEHLYGQRALKAWKANAPKDNRPWELLESQPPASREDLERARRFAALPELPRGNLPIGLLVGRQEAGPGKARVAWRAANPEGGGNVTWEEADRIKQEGKETWREVRQLLEHPAARWAEDELGIRGHRSALDFRPGGLPGFVRIRTTAQWISIMVLSDLHKGDLAAAKEDLLALAGLIRLYRDSPVMVTVMIRVAITGLATCTLWETLQAPGWTEEDLRQIQEAFAQGDLAMDLAKALKAEQALTLEKFGFCRSVDFLTAQQRAREENARLNGDPMPDPPLRRWLHQNLFHPLWRYAWSEKEELQFLQSSQWNSMPSLRRPSFMSWRFYYNLPCEPGALTVATPASPFFKPGYSLTNLLNEGLAGTLGLGGTSDPMWNTPSYVKARQTLQRNETERGMAITAIALRRYRMARGNFPATLRSLVPTFLPSIPTDRFDGKPLRYRLDEDGGYVLYSVGLDGRDDGGDADPGGLLSYGLFKGRDAVWPKPVN